MKYTILNNREYLEDLVKDKEVFVSVFNETLGYSFKKCLEFGIDVPMETLRAIPDYVRYSNVLNYFKDNKNSYELGVSFAFSEKSGKSEIIADKSLVFEESFFEGLKEGHTSKDILKLKLKVLDDYSFERKLSLSEFLLWQDVLYEYMISSSDNLKKIKPFVKNSLNAMTKDELLLVDFSFAVLDDFNEVFKDKGIVFTEIKDLYKISRAAIYLDSRIAKNPQKLGEFYNNFKDSNVSRFIPNDIWFNNNKRISYLTDFAKTIGKTTSISNSISLFNFFENSPDFYNTVTVLSPDAVLFNNVDGEPLYVKDLWNATNINSFHIKKVFNKYLSFFKDKNEKFFRFESPVVSAAFKFFRYKKENKLILLSPNEIKVFFEIYKERHWDGDVDSFMREQARSAVQSQNIRVVDEYARLFAKIFLINGTNYISEILNIKDVNFSIRSVSHMPISINKALLARALLKHYKDSKDNNDLTYEQIEELKEYMVVPDYIKGALNRYVKNKNADVVFTKSDLNLLLSYGDPSYNQLKDYRDWEFKEDKPVIQDNPEGRLVNVRELLDSANSFMSNLSDEVWDRESLVKLEEFINEIQTAYNSIKKIVELSLDDDSLVDLMSYSLKNTLKLLSPNRPVNTDLDGYFHLYLNDFEYENDSENPLFVLKQSYSNCCASLLDLSISSLAESSSERKKDILKRVEDESGFSDMDYKKMSLILPHVDKIKNFNRNEDFVYKELFNTLLLKNINSLKIKMSGLASKLSLRSNFSEVVALQNTLGASFLSVLLKENPNVAATAITIKPLSEDDEINCFTVAKDWNGLRDFIKSCLNSSPEENIFIVENEFNKIFNPEIFFTCMIKDIKHSMEQENIVPESNNFLNILNDLKNTCPIGYVCLFNESNIEEFCKNNNYCKENAINKEKIISQYWDSSAYAQGVSELFLKRFNWGKTLGVYGEFNLEKNPLLRSSFLSKAIKTVNLMPSVEKNDFF